MFNSLQPCGFSLPGSSVLGILQARILKLVALLQGIQRSRDRTCISYVPCTDKQVLYHYCHLGSPLQANVYSDFWISVAKNIIGLEIHVLSCCILISITIFFSISLLLYSIFGKSILFKFFLSLFLTKKNQSVFFS